MTLVVNMIDMVLGMVLGMILGMIASPVMMNALKSLRQRSKVTRLLREAADLQGRKDSDTDPPTR